MTVVRTAGPTGEAVIEEAVADLRDRLPRWSARAGLLREVRDGLEDAAEAYRGAGLEPRAAAIRAVADFGELDRVAAEFAELRVGRSSRAAALVLGPGYTAVLGAWLVLGPAVSVPARTPGVDGVSHAFVWLGAVAVVVAGWSLVGLRRAARRGGPTGRWARIVGLTGLSCGVLTLVASWLVAPWDLGAPTAPWGTLDDIEAFSGLVIGIMMATAGRCLAAARDRSRLEPATLVR